MSGLDQWEAFLIDNPHVSPLFPEADPNGFFPELPTEDEFLSTLQENCINYPAEWNFGWGVMNLTSGNSAYYTRLLCPTGAGSSAIPQRTSAPATEAGSAAQDAGTDFATPDLNPFQNELTDEEHGWILSDSTAFYDYVLARENEIGLAFLDERGHLSEVPGDAASFYETLFRFYDADGYALQETASELFLYDSPEDLTALHGEYETAKATGDTARAEEAAARFMEIAQTAALELATDAVATFAANGWISSGDLDGLSRYVEGFQTLPDGSTGISFTPEFATLEPAEQAAVLQDLQRIGLRSMYRAKLGETDSPYLRTYYQAHLDLMAGDPVSAQLRFVEFKAWAKNSEDPEILAMREEARGILKQLTLGLLDELATANDELLAQRLSHLGWASYNEDSNERTRELLGYLSGFVSDGKADTLDEATAVLKREHERLGEEFRDDPVVPEHWVVRYPAASSTREERETMAAAGDAFALAFSRDPAALIPDGIPQVRLEGGTIDHTWDAGGNHPTHLFVTVGPQGGTVVTPLQAYIFPPSAVERRVMLAYEGFFAPGLKSYTDYKTMIQAPYDPVAVKSDYENGHPNSLFRPLAQWANLSRTDPDMSSLFSLGSRASLAKRGTEDGDRRELLALGQSLRHRDGSYATSAKLLEQVFAGSLEDAIAAIPQSEITAINAQVTSEKAQIDKEVRARLAEQKSANPTAFAEAYPSGSPSEKEISVLVQAAMTEKAFELTRQKAFQKLDGWAQDGTLNADPMAKEAWLAYEDMLDPLSKTWNWSDATCDAVLDEVIITAVTMPLVMAGGMAVRTALLAQTFTLRLAAQGGFRALAARGLVAGAGIATEAGLQTVGTGLITGHGIGAEEFGFNMLMLTAFHGGGALWGKAAARAGIGEDAILAAGGLKRFGLSSANTAGSLATQTAVATGMTYASEIITGIDNPETFMERLGEETLRMVAFHYGTAAANKATGGRLPAAERRADLRFEVAKREGARTAATVDGAVSNARTLVPEASPAATGSARVVSIEEAQLFASRWAEIQGEVGHSYYKSVLRESLNGMVIADTSFKGSDAARTIDHHGPYATPDNKNATMKMLDLFETALKKTDGNVDAAVELLNISSVTTDNLADGMWCVWIARNQRRVLSDPALRETIRKATEFEDFTAFGSAYSRLDPNVELQAALFGKYDGILNANGIKGSDRFPSALTETIMADGCHAIDAMLANPTARREAAERFWTEVDAAAVIASTKALMPESVPGQVNFYDTKAFSKVGTLAQWLAIPQSHSLNLQVQVTPMPPIARGDGTVVAQRSLMIVAVPNARALPSGKGLLSILEAVNAAESAKARRLDVTAATWFGKDNVILANPGQGGTLLTPAELVKILTDPRHALFDPPAPRPRETERVPQDPSAIVEEPTQLMERPAPRNSTIPDLPRPPDLNLKPQGALTRVKAKTLKQSGIDVNAVRMGLPDQGMNYEFMADEAGNLWAFRMNSEEPNSQPIRCGEFFAERAAREEAGNEFPEAPRDKGTTFRGGKKSQRDNWYGYNDRDFQKWWERRGKKDFGRGDIDNAAEAREAYEHWVELGKPTAK